MNPSGLVEFDGRDASISGSVRVEPQLAPGMKTIDDKYIRECKS